MPLPFNRRVLDQYFGDLWPIHNERFTAFLIECRRLFDGDMDQLLILSVIGDRTLTEERAKGLSYPEFLEGGHTHGEPRRINTQSVADCTGIPRETVRRKINYLISRGWVKKNEDGTVQATHAAAEDLAPATEVYLDYFFTMGTLLIDILDRLPRQLEISSPVKPEARNCNP